MFIVSSSNSCISSPLIFLIPILNFFISAFQLPKESIAVVLSFAIKPSSILADFIASPSLIFSSASFLASSPSLMISLSVSSLVISCEDPGIVPCIKEDVVPLANFSFISANFLAFSSYNFSFSFKVASVTFLAASISASWSFLTFSAVTSTSLPYSFTPLVAAGYLSANSVVT